MKQRIMTLDNIGEFTFCELLEAVKQDIKRLDKKGFRFYMETWLEKTGVNCTACLGGAAMLGFATDKKLKEILKNPLKQKYFSNELSILILEDYSHSAKIKTLFLTKIMDLLRIGNLKVSLIFYSQLTGKSIPKNLHSISQKRDFSGLAMIGKKTKEQIISNLDKWIEIIEPYDF
jgi:hypothetical protein